MLSGRLAFTECQLRINHRLLATFQKQWPLSKRSTILPNHSNTLGAYPTTLPNHMKLQHFSTQHVHKPQQLSRLQQHNIVNTSSPNLIGQSPLFRTISNKPSLFTSHGAIISSSVTTMVSLNSFFSTLTSTTNSTNNNNNNINHSLHPPTSSNHTTANPTSFNDANTDSEESLMPSQDMYEVKRDYPVDVLPIVKDIKECIELRISEPIRNDGGDIHFIQYHPDTKIVELALSGACESCDKSAVTLQILVNNALKFYFPEHITKVKRIRLPGQEERDIKDNVFP